MTAQNASASTLMDTVYSSFIKAGGRQTVLLADLHEELLAGELFIDSPPDGRFSWKKLSWNAVSPYSEGQEVDVYQTKDDIPWYMVAARPRTNLATGERYQGLNIYLKRPELVERLTKALRTGDLTESAVYESLYRDVAVSPL